MRNPLSRNSAAPGSRINGVLLRAVISLSLLLPWSVAQAQIRVGPGDVLEISALGVPEMQRRVPIEADGMVSIPGVGTLAVGGMTLADLRDKIRKAITGQRVSLRTNTGAVAAVVLMADDIVVSIASFRPITVSGYVAKPGEYQYRNQLAIRDAIAMAGGFPAIRSSQDDLALRALDATGELGSLWIEFARERARIWRVKTELGDTIEGLDVVEKSVPADAPAMRADIAAIAEFAKWQLESRQSSFKRESQAIAEVIRQLDEEISVVGAQVKAEEKAHEADTAELQSLSALKDKGMVTAQRFHDTRRAALFSATRAMQAKARLSEIRRQKSERLLQQGKLASDLRVSLGQELETATARLGTLRAKIHTVNEQLQLMTAGRLAGPDAAHSRQVQFVVHRRSPQGTVRLKEAADFELLPGDALEVVMGTSAVAADTAPPVR